MKKGGIFLFIFVSSILLVSYLVLAESNFSLSNCRSDCNEARKLEREVCMADFGFCAQNCTSSSCKRTCNINRNACIKESTQEGNKCVRICRYTTLGKNTSCENGKYELGESFVEGCDECKCGFNGLVKCKKSKFCNFSNVSVSEEQCNLAGGLYYPLCTGPYFGIVCSSQKFCLCGGLESYSCPENNLCVYDFIPPNRRRGTIDGWRTLLGEKLGTIGICAQLPALETCGNGVCENIICRNCPALETRFNCPSDCF